MNVAKVIDLNQYGSHGERPQRVTVSISDAISKFQDAIAAAGLGRPDIDADGKIHRFDLPEESRGKKTGWYVLYPDDNPCPAGSFGRWDDEGSSEKWHAYINRKYEISQREMDLITERMRQAQARRVEERQLEAEQAASKATAILSAATVASDDHPYLQKKQVRAFDLRLGARNDLLIDMRDAAGAVRGFQLISPDGSKKYQPKGVDPKGLFHVIDGDRSTMYLCEGYATGASIHMATGQAVIIAFDCGNMERVATASKELFPQAKIIIAADDDRWKTKKDGSPHNPGVEHAKAVAARHGMQIVTPAFRDLSTRPTDFNDLHVLEGIDAVRGQVKGYSLNLKDWSVANIKGNAVPDREWIVDQLIPRGNAIVMAAPGGTGKGMTLLDLAIKVATPETHAIDLNASAGFMGKAITAHGPVVILSAEDDQDEIHRRIEAISGTFPEDLYVVCMPDLDGLKAILAEGKTGIELTPWWKEIVEQCRFIRPVLIIIDPIACFVWANLNDRMVGAMFMGELSHIARQIDAAVIGSHHMNKLKDSIKNLDEAKYAITGSAGFVDHGRGALAMWPEDKKQAKELCKQYGLDYAHGSILRAGLAKANFPGDKSEKILVRQPNGTLIPIDENASSRARRWKENIDLLERVIAHFAAQGHPFTLTGTTGLYERRNRLPEPLCNMGKHSIESIGQELLNSRRIERYAPMSGGKLAKWLDVPGGNFASGCGELAVGECDYFENSNTK